MGFVCVAATTIAQYKVDNNCGIGIISWTVVSRGIKLSSRGLNPLPESEFYVWSLPLLFQAFSSALEADSPASFSCDRNLRFNNTNTVHWLSMENKIVSPDATRDDEHQKLANVEENHKKGALSGAIDNICKIRGGNKIALATVPAAQISRFRFFVNRNSWVMAA